MEANYLRAAGPDNFARIEYTQSSERRGRELRSAQTEVR
jgi:hypothetical protein